MSNMEVETRVAAAGAQLWKKTGKEKGKMDLRREHVLAVVHSNADAKTIGKPRGDIVWMAVAELVATKKHVNKNMHLRPEHMELLRATGPAAMGLRPQGSAHKVELKWSVSVWLKENEETKGGVYVIRPVKLTQLENARKHTTSSRGGTAALMATITLLNTERTATLQQRPNKPANKGKWDSWVEDSVQWMVDHEWLREEEAEEVKDNALKTAEQHEVRGYTVLALNLGEGWRSVARGVEAVFPGALVVGADRRGFTWVGAAVGHLTAEIEHDWSTATTDLRWG